MKKMLLVADESDYDYRYFIGQFLNRHVAIFPIILYKFSVFNPSTKCLQTNALYCNAGNSVWYLGSISGGRIV
jgi:hypothetical protein